MPADVRAVLDELVLAPCVRQRHSEGGDVGEVFEALVWAIALESGVPVDMESGSVRVRELVYDLGARGVECSGRGRVRVTTAASDAAVRVARESSCAWVVRYIGAALAEMPSGEAPRGKGTPLLCRVANPYAAVRALMFGLSVMQQGWVGYVLAYGMLDGRGAEAERAARVLAGTVNQPMQVSGEAGQMLVDVCRPDVRPGRASAFDKRHGWCTTQHSTVEVVGMSGAGAEKRASPPAESGAGAKRKAGGKNAAPPMVDVGGIRVPSTELQHVVAGYSADRSGVHGDPLRPYRFVWHEQTTMYGVARGLLLYYLLLSIFAHEQRCGRYLPGLYEEVPALAEHARLFRRVFSPRM